MEFIFHLKVVFILVLTFLTHWKMISLTNVNDNVKKFMWKMISLTNVNVKKIMWKMISDKCQCKENYVCLLGDLNSLPWAFHWYTILLQFCFCYFIIVAILINCFYWTHILMALKKSFFEFYSCRGLEYTYYMAFLNQLTSLNIAKYMNI